VSRKNRAIELFARALIGVAVVALVVGCAEDAPRRPDVVLIVVDSLRADHLSHQGYEFPTAASLDAFRADAALFEQAFAPTPSSAPSVASLLTGLLPIRHRLGREERLAQDVPTLASLLRDSGYATLALSHHARISAETGLDRGFERFEGTRGGLLEYPDASEAVAWVRELVAREPPQPFFLYLHLMNVHGPYRVPPDRRAVLLGRPPEKGLRFGDPLMRGVVRGDPTAVEKITTTHVRSLTEQYDTAVRYTLDRVAEILRLLEHAGVYRDALIVLTSDHGDELFEHGSFGHGVTLHREVLQVPLYVKRPGIADGRRFDAPVALLDVVPSVLDLLGLPPIPGDGRSLAPWLRGETPPEETRVLLHEIPGDANGARAITSGRYKLIALPGPPGPGRRQLYDRVLDPRETEDIAEAGGELVRDLSARLDAAFAELAAPPASEPR
jgi:arylsulfatase A-like enzyme